VFFLTKVLYRNNLTAIFAAFLTAISPWHIQFSRFGTENIRLPFYFGLFLLFFLLGIQKSEANQKLHKQRLFLALSIISLFLGFYSYTAAAVFTFPFLLGFIVIYKQYFLKHKTFSLVLLGLVLLCCMPFVYQMLNFSQESRFAQVSVFKNTSFGNAIIEMLTTYVQSYSPDFLFFKGDAGMPGILLIAFQ